MHLAQGCCMLVDTSNYRYQAQNSRIQNASQGGLVRAGALLLMHLRAGALLVGMSN